MESSDQLKKITGDLSKQQPENMVRSLKCLRYKYIKRNCDDAVIEKFCAVDGVKALTLLLFSVQKTELFDYSLSILANCCVGSETARRHVIQANGIKAIGHILNGLAKFSILDRACRLLGNLLRDTVSYKSMEENKQIIPSIVDYLKDSIEEENDDSIKNAIRTARYMTKVSPQCAADIVELKIVEVLIKQLEKEKYDLYEPVLLLLYDLGINATNDFSFQQQVANGSLLQMIVKFTSHQNSKPRQIALMFIVNQTMKMPEQMGNAGAVPILINTLKNMESHKIEKSEIIESLCCLLYQAGNRCRMYKYGGLQCLVKLLNSDDYENFESSHSAIIIALLQCLYDDASMNTLQELDIITCLLEQLNQFINKRRGSHSLSENSINPRNKIDLSVFDVCPEDIRNLLKPDELENKYDIFQLIEAPKSPDTQEQSSVEYSANSPSYQMILVNQTDFCSEPSSTPNRNQPFSFSPSSPSCFSPNKSPMSESYSPLGCISPVSPSSPMSFASDVSVWSDDLQDPIFSDQDDDLEENSERKVEKSPTKNTKRRLTCDFKNWGKQKKRLSLESKPNSEMSPLKRKKISKGPTDDQKVMDSIFTILAKYTWKVDGKPITKCVINQIPRYFEVFLSFICDVPMDQSMKKHGHSIRPFYSACKTLCRIASDFECLSKIMTCNIPKMIKKMSESLYHEDRLCEQCFVIRRFCRKILERDLKVVAESVMGQSKLQELITSSAEQRIQIAQSLPSLLTSRKIVHKFYVQLELMSDLINSFNEDPLSEIFVNTIRSVMMLAKIIGIKRNTNTRDEEKLPVQCLYNNKFGKDNLYDVWFLLPGGHNVGACKAALMNTDFFRAMFCGNFSETCQSEIRIAEDVGLEAFLLMMHYLHCSCIPCDGSVELMSECKDILELLHLADKYLLKDLQFSLHEQIMCQVNEENVINILCAASLIQDQVLVKFAVNFLLSGQMNLQDRVKCFEKLIACEEYKCSALALLEEILLEHMNS
ncbi:Armadillo repeat-containing protein 5 [Nymphon striatum]|nr:Armadillo repeat-containing protein 5 [Nymphon striatum]